MRMFNYFIESQDFEPDLTKHWVHADKIESSIILNVEPDAIHPEKLPEDPDVTPQAYLGDPYLNVDTSLDRRIPQALRQASVHRR